MQRQYTLEVRVDFQDENKKLAMVQLMRIAARQLQANAMLLADGGAKPQIVLFSEDMFAGHEDIEAMEDLAAVGKEELAAAGGMAEEAEEISQELVDAVRAQQTAHRPRC
jgi:hypothetical protein